MKMMHGTSGWFSVVCTQKSSFVGGNSDNLEQGPACKHRNEPVCKPRINLIENVSF